jgi:hypothetical protein
VCRVQQAQTSSVESTAAWKKGYKELVIRDSPGYSLPEVYSALTRMPRQILHQQATDVPDDAPRNPEPDE